RTGTEGVRLSERDAARVLHRSGIELRNEELVVLAEDVGIAEVLLEEVEPLLRDQEDLIGVEVLRQRSAAVDTEVDVVVAVANDVVRTRDDRGDVARHALGAREVPGAGAVRGLLERFGVADDEPPVWSGDRELERAFDVRLIEVRIRLVRLARLELRVQVGLSVDG